MTEVARTPLAGITVLDLSRVLAGPWSTMALADLGAEVWKIEKIDGGDESRAWRPPAYNDAATFYLAANRSKKSIALDFGTSVGQEIVRDLASRADVLVENFRTGTLERYGLDARSLCASNPRLIYCSISGYGRTGSRAHEAGYDLVIQAESGLMSINGEPGGEPQKFGVAIADLVAGMNATQAILAALYARERSGRGDVIDIALLDASVALLANVAASSLNTGVAAKRYGNAHPSIVPYQSFAAADGKFVLACANDRQFREVCSNVIGRPDLGADVRFLTNEERVKNRGALVSILAGIFATRRRDEVIEACRLAKVPAGRVHSVEDALASPGADERGMVVVTRDGTRLTNSPIRFAEASMTIAQPPPRLGEHTDEILGGILAYDAEKLQRLRNEKIIA